MVLNSHNFIGSDNHIHPALDFPEDVKGEPISIDKKKMLGLGKICCHEDDLGVRQGLNFRDQELITLCSTIRIHLNIMTPHSLISGKFHAF